MSANRHIGGTSQVTEPDSAGSFRPRSAPKAEERDQRQVVLSVQDLKKTIGRKSIIKGIAFDIREGEIFGFLGPNGSGKTTTIRMLVDLIRPTSGSVRICGYDVRKAHDEALRHVGAIVENPEMYPFFTGYENLEHFARMLPGVGDARIREVAAMVGLDRRIGDKVRTYSLGMRQRLGIAQALLGRPKLLILDEPTNGLDPQGIKEMRQFLRQLAAEGLSLLISSHLLSEVQAMCDRVAILHRGETIAVGSVEELLRDFRSQVLWTVDDPAKAAEILRADPHIALAAEEDWNLPTAAESDGRTLLAEMSEDKVPELLARMMDAGVRVYAAHPRTPSLEDLFLQLTEGDPIE